MVLATPTWMPAAALDGAGGGSDDHRMQIVTETSHVTGSTEGASPAPLVATDANSPPRAPPRRRLHARAP
eukprot:684615-Prymnesium_polylepis.1